MNAYKFTIFRAKHQQIAGPQPTKRPRCEMSGFCGFAADLGSLPTAHENRTNSLPGELRSSGMPDF